MSVVNFFENNMRTINIITFLIVLCCILVGIWLSKTGKENKQWLINDENIFWSKILPLIVFAFGVIIRLAEFPNMPAGVNQDEVMTAVDAKALSVYGTDRYGNFLPVHLQGWTYGQQSALLAYLTVPFVKVLGLNTLSTRLPIMILSIVGMVMIYLLLKKTLGNTAACVGLFLTAINPFLFMQTRWALDCNTYPHVFIIGFALLTVGTCKSKYWMTYLSMAFFGLSMYGYGVSFFFVPLFLIASAIYLCVLKKMNIRQVLLCVLVYLLVSWPEYLVMIINYFKLPTIELPFMTIQYFDKSVRSNDIVWFSDNVFDTFKANLSSVIDTFVLQRHQDAYDILREYGTIYKCSYPLLALGVVVSFARAIKKKENGIIYGILCIYLLTSLFMAVSIVNINVSRGNIIWYSYVLLCTVGVLYVFENLKVSKVLIPMTLAFMAVGFFGEYFNDGCSRVSVYMYPDFLEALDYAKSLNKETYYITPDTKYPGAVAVTEIITMFQYDIDAKYWRGEVETSEDYASPYADTFIYENAWDREEHNENAVYIYRMTEESYNYYTSELYDTKNFTTYGVAVHK